MERLWYLIISLFIYGILTAIIAAILDENKKEDDNKSILYHIIIGASWPFIFVGLFCVLLFTPFYYITKIFVKYLKK
jgi:hypothetical protein